MLHRDHNVGSPGTLPIVLTEAGARAAAELGSIPDKRMPWWEATEGTRDESPAAKSANLISQ